jgi:hypothetical protein
MIGGVMLARAVDAAAPSDEIVREVAAALGQGGAAAPE